MHLCSKLYCPQPNLKIFAIAGEKLPIGAEGNTVDLAEITYESVDELAGWQVPEFNGEVTASGGQGLTIGFNGYAPYSSSMTY